MRSQIDSILLDFSKAFDKVDHKGLVVKLKGYGISNKLLDWDTSFRLDRSQTVIVDGDESTPVTVKLGVPQGTVLGPLLFLIYINDIDKHLNPETNLRLFADDSFFFRQKTYHDTKILEDDLDTLQQWEKNGKFHPDKCQVLKITNKNNPIKSQYKIHNKMLGETKIGKIPRCNH